MKRLGLVVLALALTGCYTMHLDCPCNGQSVTATTGGQTALLDAILPLLGKAGSGLVLAATSNGPTKPQSCGTVDTNGIDLLGAATICLNNFRHCFNYNNKRGVSGYGKSSRFVLRRSDSTLDYCAGG